MTATNTRLIQLRYGRGGCWSAEIDSERVLESPPAPDAIDNLRTELDFELSDPLDFPPLDQAAVPGDRVILALDRRTPQAETVVAAVWEKLAARGVDPDGFNIVRPAGNLRLPDPRNELPKGVRDGVGLIDHNPADESACAYLATTAGGERIYLNRALAEADLLITAGAMRFDTLLGYRGTNSAIYPDLSNIEAIRRMQGQGHRELDPDNERPLRTIVDEIGWLLGALFTIQLIPSAGGGAANVLAGSCESVFRAGRKLLEDYWRIELDERAEIVVMSIDGADDGAGTGWEQIGAALATGRNLVAPGGRIVILSEVDAVEGDGLSIIRGSYEPGDAVRPLRDAAPADLVPATQLAAAADWARVYLLSGLDQGLVEDLFMIPLGSEAEATRLLTSNEDHCLFLESAQNTYGRVR